MARKNKKKWVRKGKVGMRMENLDDNNDDNWKNSKNAMMLMMLMQTLANTKKKNTSQNPLDMY